MASKHKIAACTAISVFCFYVLIQFAVAARVLPVTILWGGVYDDWTPQLALASLLGAAILLGMSYVIHQRAYRSDPSRTIRVLAWVVATYMLLNTAGNLASKTVFERYVSGSLTAIASVASFIVASNSPSSALFAVREWRYRCGCELHVCCTHKSPYVAPETMAPRNIVLFPAATDDYYVTAGGKFGLGLVAARNIRQGTRVLDDSLEYTIADVAADGKDRLWFSKHEIASRATKSELPPFIPLTRHMLQVTHGVLQYDAKSDEIWAYLEIPAMLMNHSCDPNVTFKNTTTSEDHASKKIRKGDELTTDYALQYYAQSTCSGPCHCGATNCRGEMLGFAQLSPEEQVRLLPYASEAVQRLYRADHEAVPRHPPLRPIPTRPEYSGCDVCYVWPNPSYAWAPVCLVKNNDNQWQLQCCKRVNKGRKVYEYWQQAWPSAETRRALEGNEGVVNEDSPPSPIHVVLAEVLVPDTDSQEGTSLGAISPRYQTRAGYHHGGWHEALKHSSTPNVVPKTKYAEEESYDWQAVYALRDIEEGEILTMEYNFICWDVPSNNFPNNDVIGFSKLSPDKRMECKSMSHLHVPDKGTPGEALSPHVRECWRKHMPEEAPAIGSDDESGSSSSESEDE